MSTEKLAPALCTDTTVCEPNATVSSTVVTKRNQQIFTQQTISSRIRKINPMTDGENPSSQMNSLLPLNESSSIVTSSTSNIKNSHVDVKRTTKTYCRKIIRKIGPNGEVSEEIIEEGEPPANFFPQTSQMSLQNQNFPSISSQSTNTIDSLTPKISGGTNFQATAGFQSVSQTGEQQSVQLSTGPMQISFNDSENRMLSSENNRSFDNADSDQRDKLGLVTSSGNSVQQILPDGTIVTRKFYGEKSATVTHSSTINGQTLTSSKSAYMSFSGESMLEANSSINDMEMIFGKMMEGMKGSTLNIFNHFITSNNNTMLDHMALAGGDMGCSLLALEPPECSTPEPEISSGLPFFKNKNRQFKSLTAPETIHETSIVQPVPSKISKDQQEEALIEKQIKAIKDSKASNRLYWSNMDEVKSSGVLNSMKKEEIHLQEAIFEVITSEASYNISLDTLIEYYYKSDLLNAHKQDSIINHVEKHHLFSNILLIKAVSIKLLKDLESRWSQQKPKMIDLADIILKHAEDKDFQQQYINYLTNQSYQINALKSLLSKEIFKQALYTIQSNPQCCKLSLDSFLALPMQRLTRLKLLTEVIMKLMKQSKELYEKIPKEVVENNRKALEKLRELLTACEENKFKMEQKARLIDLCKFLEFKNSSRQVAIGSMDLIKDGEVRAASNQISSNALKKLSKKRQPTFYLIVLSELVIFSKKKSQNKYVVLEHCSRNKVKASVELDIATSISGPKTSRASIGSQLSISSSSSYDSSTQAVIGHPFVLKFEKENDSLLPESLVLTVPTSEIRELWINAINSK